MSDLPEFIEDERDMAAVAPGAIKYWTERALKAEREHDKLADANIRLHTEVSAWRFALEGLTPGGSEFSGDPQRCVEYVRSRMEQTVRLKVERDTITAHRDALMDAANAVNQAIDELYSVTPDLHDARVKLRLALTYLEES